VSCVRSFILYYIVYYVLAVKYIYNILLYCRDVRRLFHCNDVKSIKSVFYYTSVSPGNIIIFFLLLKNFGSCGNLSDRQCFTL